jgi:hypothetical protein
MEERGHHSHPNVRADWLSSHGSPARYRLGCCPKPKSGGRFSQKTFGPCATCCAPGSIQLFRPHDRSIWFEKATSLFETETRYLEHEISRLFKSGSTSDRFVMKKFRASLAYSFSLRREGEKSARERFFRSLTTSNSCYDSFSK